MNTDPKRKAMQSTITNYSNGSAFISATMWWDKMNLDREDIAAIYVLCRSECVLGIWFK